MKPVRKYKKERKEVARFMRRLYKYGLTTTSGGNISLRISDEIIIITPSATDKGRMRWEEVGTMNITGENLIKELKPSIEFDMHLSIYRKNKDVTAIVHAHPLFATSFTAMKYKIKTNLTAEAKAILGDPLFIPYAVMGSGELANLVAENVLHADILLLEFDKIEVLENAAKMTLIVDMTNKGSPLSQTRVREIEKLFR